VEGAELGVTSVAEASPTTSEPQPVETSGAPVPVSPAATSAPVPPPELVGGLAGRVEVTDKGTVVAISFEDDRVMRGLCWNIAVWDGAAFVVTYVTSSRETAEEASDLGIFRLTSFGGAVYVCLAIALAGFGPDYFFFPSVVGAGTFRICQDEDCFQFTTDSAGSRPSTSLAPPSPVVSTLVPAPALEGGLSPLVESGADGTLVALWFEPPMEIADCWTISVWDGDQFVETLVTTMEQTAKDAKEAEVSRLDVPGSTFPCPDTARIQQLTFMFMDADVIGSGTFRVCQEEQCFQFAR